MSLELWWEDMQTLASAPIGDLDPLSRRAVLEGLEGFFSAGLGWWSSPAARALVECYGPGERELTPAQVQKLSGKSRAWVHELKRRWGGLDAAQVRRELL